MQADYKRDVNHSYLILYGPDEVNTSGYQTRMLLCNHFSGLLPCKIQAMDGQSLFYYEITSHQSFSERYEKKKIGREEMQGFFQGIIQAVQELGSYLLDADNLVLDPVFIYLEGDLSRVHFCYLPGYEKRISEQFLDLTEYLLPKIDHKDQQAVTLGYGMYRIAMEEEFQVDRIKEELYRKYEKKQENRISETDFVEQREDLPQLDSTEEHQESFEEEDIPQFMRESPSSDEKKWKKEILLILSAVFAFTLLFLAFRLAMLELAAVLAGFAALIGVSAFIIWIISKRKGQKDFEVEQKSVSAFQKEDYSAGGLKDCAKGKTVEEGEEKKENESQETQPESQLTVVLSESSARAGSSLISKEEGRLPTILLDRELLIIGKLDTVSDVILPYPTVSRVHSKIRQIEGEYYLTDLNSRNGTFVNGRMLQAEEEYQLQDQDEVRFADLTYIFLK